MKGLYNNQNKIRLNLMELFTIKFIGIINMNI